MTVDDHDVTESSFNGLMQALNLDSNQFKEYDIESFHQLNFQQLSQLKTEIESQLTILFDLLRQKYNADMETKLVTIDGFPRSDIDVVSIRLIRVRIIRLRNDDKLIIHLLEQKMAEEFASRKDQVEEEPQEQQTSSPAADRQILTQRYTIPFARVCQIVPSGPAEKSGLKEGDQIILFDNDIHAVNNRKLAELVIRVRSKQDQNINVDIKRGDERINLVLKPTDKWDGQGLLGCRLVPI